MTGFLFWPYGVICIFLGIWTSGVGCVVYLDMNKWLVHSFNHLHRYIPLKILYLIFPGRFDIPTSTDFHPSSWLLDPVLVNQCVPFSQVFVDWRWRLFAFNTRSKLFHFAFRCPKANNEKNMTRLSPLFFLGEASSVTNFPTKHPNRWMPPFLTRAATVLNRPLKWNSTSRRMPPQRGTGGSSLGVGSG